MYAYASDYKYPKGLNLILRTPVVVELFDHLRLGPYLDSIQSLNRWTIVHMIYIS